MDERDAVTDLRSNELSDFTEALSLALVDAFDPAGDDEAAPPVPESAQPALRRRVRRKRFAEETAGKARLAAGEWLRDFSRHGPLEIRKITTSACRRDKFLTTVTYVRA
jgi:hypothetical protein